MNIDPKGDTYDLSGLSQDVRRKVENDLALAVNSKYGKEAKTLVEWASDSSDISITMVEGAAEDLRDKAGNVMAATYALTAAMGSLYSPLSVANIEAFRRDRKLRIILFPSLTPTCFIARNNDLSSSEFAEPVIHELLHVWAAAVSIGATQSSTYSDLTAIFDQVQSVNPLTVEGFRKEKGYEFHVSRWASGDLRKKVYR